MKLLKRFILVGLGLMAVSFIFRGWLYRQMVEYKTIGQRSNFEVTNQQFVDYLKANAGTSQQLELKEVIELALSATSRRLHYRTSQASPNPNILINSKAAHCVGYASFFAASCNYYLKRNKLATTWVAIPQIGQLHFLGINIHNYLNSPFFKDHDFVTIENQITGEWYAVDPSLNDYFQIGLVTYKP